MKKIYVGNLSYKTAEKELESAFSAFGTVVSVSIVRDLQTGESRGFGFVEMEQDEEAAAAITGLGGTELDGRTLTVNEARPRPERSHRPGGGGRRGGPGGGGPRGGGPGRRW
ncbi:MAG: RNA-binding protein [Candidatus Tectomicrobia bacterium]|nr:RNA-binding protein [Candidatus Tectomicrobia bacterium]